MWLVLVVSCVRQADVPLTREQALDPLTCAECHPDHYEQWRGSMHAYSSFDPVFLALNARGQRDSAGALGTLCVQCHAPVAVQEGETSDGLNLDDLPDSRRGIGCTYCHTVNGVGELFNNDLLHADDLVQRAAIDDPVPALAHASAYDELHDRRRLRSADPCGSCHDVVTPAGLHLERLYSEWTQTQYATATSGLQQTCGNCHMDGYDGLAANTGDVPVRRLHDHGFPAVDTALVPFPNTEEQADMVQDRLDPTVRSELLACASAEGVELRLRLENIAAGHGFPSGAGQHRRAWVEVNAFAGDTLVFSTGKLDDAVSVAEAAHADPDLWWLGDRLYDADGNEVHGAWAAASLDSSTLPGLGADGDSHVSRTWYLGDTVPTRVEAIVHLRALDRDLLQWLVDGGDLDPRYLDAVPTRDLAQSAVTWSDLLDRCPE